MSNKSIRTPQALKKVKKEKKQRKPLERKTVITVIICIATAIILAAGGILTYSLLTRFNPKVTDMHSQMNALPESISSSVVFKDGGIYLCTKDEQILIDPNVYDPTVEGAVDQVTYYWNCNDGTLIYLSDPSGEKKLMQYKDGKSTFLFKNVSSFTISPDRSKIAIVYGANSSGLNGSLLISENGEETLLETGNVKANTVYFSADSTTLFAQLSNASKGELHMYRDGKETVLENNIFALGWISLDGNTYLTVEASETAYVYHYTLKTLQGKKLSFKNVTYSEASPDGSVMYILHNYDSTSQLCTLTIVDTATLNHHEIAKNVYSLNPTSVTDSARGIIYATSTITEGRYDLYYFDVLKKKNIILAKKVYPTSINNVIINSDSNSGYMLLSGNNTSNSQLFYFDISSGSIKTENISVKNGKTDVTAIYELLYYEACDSLIISANPDQTSLEIYQIKDKVGSKLINSCGAIYDSSTGAYYSCSMLTNNGKYAVYLKNIVIIDQTDDDKFADHARANIYGSLVVYDIEKQEYTAISANVLADTFDCIQVSGDGSDIFFMTLVDGGKFNAYHYDTTTGEKTLLLSNVDSMASYG